jgi:hypothetical protein
MATCSITDSFVVDAAAFEKAFLEAERIAVPMTKKEQEEARRFAFEANLPKTLDLAKGTLKGVEEV